MDTHYGGSGFREADFLLKNAPNKTNHGFWDQVDPSTYWDPIDPDYSQEQTWTHVDSSTNQPVIGPAAYFNTIEHNLNTAIYYCATALNYILLLSPSTSLKLLTSFGRSRLSSTTGIFFSIINNVFFRIFVRHI